MVTICCLLIIVVVVVMNTNSNIALKISVDESIIMIIIIIMNNIVRTSYSSSTKKNVNWVTKGIKQIKNQNRSDSHSWCLKIKVSSLQPNCNKWIFISTPIRWDFQTCVWMRRSGPSLYSSCSLSVFPLGRAAVGQRVTVWKLLPKHAFEAEFRDASSSSGVHVPADVNQPTSPNPLRATNRQAALTKAVRDVRFLSLLKDSLRGILWISLFWWYFAARRSLEY